MTTQFSYLFSDYRIWLIGIVFALGCDCCCECKGEEVSNFTLTILFYPDYTGRTCTIPVPAGELTNVGGNIIPFLVNSDPGTGPEDFLDKNKYYLWVEFETCCDEFNTSTEFRNLVSAGTAYSVGNKPTKYYIALNTTSGSMSPTFPIPTSSESGSPQITVKYYEPCLTSCENPNPCAGGTPYRVIYKGGVLAPWSSSDPHADVSSATMLMHEQTFCNPPEGWMCN